MDKRFILIFFLYIFCITSCELLQKKETINGVWKVHYTYPEQKKSVMAVTFNTDHSFSFRVDDEISAGVWTLKDNTLELEFSQNMIWKAPFNKEKIRNGYMINSGYGDGGGQWDAEKIE